MEIELQYTYEGDLQAVPTDLAGMALAESDRVMLTDTYYDTGDLALRRAGCTLRVRVNGADASAYLTWKGPAKRRRGGQKRRDEIEFRIPTVPRDESELEELLRRYRVDRLMRKEAGVRSPDALNEIGVLRNERSRHVYVQGLHRLELTWDRLSFPVGADEVRLELEIKAEHAERYLDDADAELRALLGDDLRRARRGKVRELCERLYPELMAAA